MKSEKGSITLFVLIAMVFFLGIAMTAYMSASGKLLGQNADLAQIEANYARSLSAEGLATLYQNLTDPGGKASRYTYKDGIWCNSPELVGFNLTCTYYVSYDDNGNETISTKSIAEMEDPPSDWYSYKEKRWANIVTINNGNITYWTWIPRFVYKTPSQDSSLPANTTDVKFVGDDGSGNEVCYMMENGEKVTIDVSTYETSNAFTFNGKQLNGYWVSKYRVQEDGSQDASLTNIEVDVSGFNPSVTKYVTYDNSGNATEGANIQLGENGQATNMPQNWYDYKNKKWANLVTENNGLKSYWTYIPRFQYKMTDWNYLGPAVLFSKITDSLQQGYKISNAFTFNGQQLRGYWASKYRVEDNTNNTDFNGTYYSMSD